MQTTALEAFIAHSADFADVVGPAPRLTKVVETDAHEGPVYVAREDALYFTSLPRAVDGPVPGARSVAVRRLQLDGDRFPRSPGEVSTLREPANMANGLAFSPDESVLYVGDSGAIHGPDEYSVQRPHHVLAFDVRDGRHVTNQRLLAVIAHGFPDGIKVDSAGRVYVSSFRGIEVFSPEGDPLGSIHLPGAVNFTFGGPDGNLLFITADSAIWVAVLQAVGR